MIEQWGLMQGLTPARAIGQRAVSPVVEAPEAILQGGRLQSNSQVERLISLSSPPSPPSGRSRLTNGGFSSFVAGMGGLLLF